MSTETQKAANGNFPCYSESMDGHKCKDQCIDCSQDLKPAEHPQPAEPAANDVENDRDNYLDAIIDRRANQTSTPIRKPLHNIKGIATYIGEPSLELENAVNKMAELAYESTSTLMEVESDEQAAKRIWFNRNPSSDEPKHYWGTVWMVMAEAIEYGRNTASNTHKSKLDEAVELLRESQKEILHLKHEYRDSGHAMKHLSKINDFLSKYEQ